MQVMQQVLQDLLMEEVVELVGQVEMLVLLQLVDRDWETQEVDYLILHYLV